MPLLLFEFVSRWLFLATSALCPSALSGFGTSCRCKSQVVCPAGLGCTDCMLHIFSRSSKFPLPRSSVSFWLFPSPLFESTAPSVYNCLLFLLRSEASFVSGSVWHKIALFFLVLSCGLEVLRIRTASIIFVSGKWLYTAF